eukprot:scaffold6168_cov420-Prasinococcus_capsulatus_cf.AAC.1
MMLQAHVPIGCLPDTASLRLAFENNKAVNAVLFQSLARYQTTKTTPDYANYGAAKLELVVASARRQRLTSPDTARALLVRAAPRQCEAAARRG